MLIPAAGSSLRMGEGVSKPLIVLNGKTILERAIEPFLEIELFEHIIVLSNPESQNAYHSLLSKKDPRIQIIQGGKTRQQSVCAGLEFLKKEIKESENHFVAIHDAARCMISRDLIELAIKEVIINKAVTLAVPLTDSLLQVEKGSTRAQRCLDRNSVIAVQTPQVFSFDLIYERHMYYKEKSIWDFTDDCALLEGKHDVYIVPGSKKNIKITTKEDLLFVNAVLSGSTL